MPTVTLSGRGAMVLGVLVAPAWHGLLLRNSRVPLSVSALRLGRLGSLERLTASARGAPVLWPMVSSRLAWVRLLYAIIVLTVGMLLHVLARTAGESTVGVQVRLCVRRVVLVNGQNAARCYVGLRLLVTTGVTMPISRVCEVECM